MLGEMRGLQLLQNLLHKGVFGGFIAFACRGLNAFECYKLAPRLAEKHGHEAKLVIARRDTGFKFRVLGGNGLNISHLPTDIVSATQITSSSDLKNKVYYYHTMWNRQVRKINLTAIDFSTIKEYIIDEDAPRMNSVKDVTPVAPKGKN